MLVADRMTRNPITVCPQDTLADARGKMGSGGFRQLPVVSEGRVVGIITDRDIRERSMQLRLTTVATAMTEEIVIVTPQTSLAAAARMLLEYKIGGLPVLEGEKLVGIITTSDLLKTFIDVAERSPSAIATRSA
ncbi:MAG: CBS domain-containing protein [Candidatus Binatia bacterium]